ncbi:MAG: AraC family transcriptional regulator [Lachnospiraceae bacterium]|nr:AraC family transcriptional regulator [Lachnospiraceae bacterium]
MGKEAIHTELEKALIESKENERYHNTYHFEQEYLGLIEKGDVKGLSDLFENVPELTAGTVATDALRQAKNLFIASVTLITRSSITGGLDIETAYHLSDSYIKEAERMSDPTAVLFLNRTAALDYAKRVSEAKVPGGMSREIFDCIQYISNHVNSKISVAKLAASLNLDRSTLSKKFKRELGFNISDFIMRRKLEEAKSLLHHTDKTVSEISEYLCFSTQSYFQSVFKKKYGCTPKECRRKIREGAIHTDSI